MRLIILLALLGFLSCLEQKTPDPIQNSAALPAVQTEFNSVGEIPTPNGYQRLETTDHSFSNWLRNLHLKKDKTVYLFDGSKKRNQSAQFAVIDLPGARPISSNARMLL